jgi:hypothetical protein
VLTLDSAVHIPAHVSFSVVDQDAFLLNTRTNQYYALEEVGARLWELLNAGQSLRDGYNVILGEYEIDPAQLEQDLLELLNHLLENGLVEIVRG